MGAQKLGYKKVRKLARETELDVTRAWVGQNHGWLFATRDHQHGWALLGADRQIVDWGLYPSDSADYHYTSCYWAGVLLDELPEWSGD